MANLTTKNTQLVGVVNFYLALTMMMNPSPQHSQNCIWCQF